MQIDPQTEAVEARHAAEHFKTGAQIISDGCFCLQGAGIKIQIRKTDTLWGSAGSAAVKDDGGFFRIKF